MKKDKIKLYILQAILVIVLTTSLFFTRLLNSKIELALFLSAVGVMVYFLIRKSTRLHIRKKQATRLIAILSVIYLGIFYTFGIYTGFYKSLHTFSLTTLYKYIIPIVAIIISSEIIRYKFITIENKVSMVFNFIIGVLIDISIYSNLYAFSSLDDFLLSIGYLTFAAVASNLLYNYISKRFGPKPVIIYRLVISLYSYIIPIIPDVYIFFRTFFRMIYPLIVYYILEDNFGNKKESLEIKKEGKSNILSILSFSVMAVFIMLISCKFRYGALVIGSGSMRKTIDKGDVIVYDSKINKGEINVGDILVFEKEDRILVHRVIKIDTRNNAKLYYTKGDNNQMQDDGFIKEEAILGRVNFSIPVIGRPTVWLNEMFKKK